MVNRTGMDQLTRKELKNVSIDTRREEKKGEKRARKRD